MNLKDTDVAILCGGLGTRLRQTIGEKQKTMAEVNGRPFLDILLEYLAGQGFRRAILCAGYQAQDIQARYASGKYGLKIEVSAEPEPLGTGGAIVNAKGLIQSDPFFVLNGDCFCDCDYSALLTEHARRKADMTLVLVRLLEKKDYGSIVVGPDNRIVDFREKAAETSDVMFISAGIYCFQKKVFDWMPPQKKFMVERDFFPQHVQKKMFGFEARGQFLDIGTPQRFEAAQTLLRKEKNT